jgi:hypothetical protein
MAEPRIDDPSARARRERWLAAGVVTLLILLRSMVFVGWPQSHFDADQAITGLMAKHLSDGRAFPVFYYGQNYILAVEAWITAPVFLLAGVSVTTLRLPLLAINIAVGLLLLRVLERDVGLRPALAILPTLFFALPPPGTTSHLLEATGGNIEPFLYVLLLWITRQRPNWGGVILGVGFLQREFTIYGLLALCVVEARGGALFRREGLRRRAVMLRAAAEVWLVVQFVKHYSSAAGPGTTIGDLYHPRDNVMELAARICWDMATIPSGFWRLLTEHWPVLFGSRSLSLGDFGIDSAAWQGLAGGWLLFAGAALIAIVCVARRVVVTRRWLPEYDACLYLILVALLSASAYVLARCGEVDFVVMRYELLSLFGAVGVAAWFLRVESWTTLRRVWIVLVLGCATINAVAHGRLIAEYLTHPPAGAKQLIVRNLEARGARYALADYWLAYSITFLTNERIIAASSDFIRIQEYQRILAQHRAEAVRISRSACDGGREVIRGIYFCP